MNLKTVTSSLVLMNLLCAPPAVQAAMSGKDIAMHGNGKGAIACSSCHGTQGQGNAKQAYPYLAGQSAHYLVKQLQDYASGRRHSPVMQPFARALSISEIKAVANYFAGLPLPDKAAANSKPASTTGQRLATQGKWEDGVPACFQCHGDNGQGVAASFPAISGQPRAYIEKQLHAWRKGARSNDPIGLMQAVVTNLNDKEITAVSGFLSSQAPIKSQ